MEYKRAKKSQPREVAELNIDKYYALAYQTKPYGIVLTDMVERNWDQWVEIVEKSNWIKSWHEPTNIPITPKGNIQNNSKAQKIATKIFTLAVWGFGVSDWLHSKKACTIFTPYYKKSVPLFGHVLVDHGLKTVPIEFLELNLWLEPMWQQAQIDQTR